MEWRRPIQRALAPAPADGLLVGGGGPPFTSSLPWSPPPPPPPPPTHTHTPTTTAVLTTKEYMRVVSEIKPEWLVSSSHICAAAALLTTYAWMMGCMDEWLLSVQGATMSSLQQLQLQQ